MSSRSLSLFDNPFADDEEETRPIRDAITKALYPFDPGRMLISTMRSDMDILHIEIDIQLLREYPFKRKINILDIPDLTIDFMTLVADLAAEHYASLPRIDPEDHIILGTD